MLCVKMRHVFSMWFSVRKMISSRDVLMILFLYQKFFLVKSVLYFSNQKQEGHTLSCLTLLLLAFNEIARMKNNKYLVSYSHKQAPRLFL